MERPPAAEGRRSESTLRADFYDRFRSLRIPLLFLRDRPWDIPLLLDHYRRHHERKQRKRTLGFTPEALRSLVAYDCPGNVRELAHACSLFVIHARPGAWIDPDLLDACLPDLRSKDPTRRPCRSSPRASRCATPSAPSSAS